MLAALCLGLSLVCAGASPPSAGPVEVHIQPDGRKPWTVRYETEQPVSRLVFPQSPDDSRARGWRPEVGFEVVSGPDGEALRRVDGAAFSAATVVMDPVYRELPKSYAPFSPYGDGGMLFHTGRMFACAEACADGQTYRFVLTSDHPVLVDGRSNEGEVAWTDRDDGRSVYVGDTLPAETEFGSAIIDGALPAAIREQLERELPAFMTLYAGKLGTLDYRPMLFVSYDTRHDEPGRFGNQGGTLPGQVFIHLYGLEWERRLAEGDAADGLRWHFAHEAAHLYQRQLFAPEPENAWIHEGGAEAMAWLALRDTDPALAEAHLADARTRCGASLAAAGSVRQAVTAGDFDASYVCGFLILVEVDARVRAAKPDSDGLFTVWRAYVDKAGGRGSEAAFLAAVRSVGGAGLAAWTEGAARSAAIGA